MKMYANIGLMGVWLIDDGINDQNGIFIVKSDLWNWMIFQCPIGIHWLMMV